MLKVSKSYLIIVSLLLSATSFGAEKEKDFNYLQCDPSGPGADGRQVQVIYRYREGQEKDGVFLGRYTIPGLLGSSSDLAVLECGKPIEYPKEKVDEAVRKHSALVRQVCQQKDKIWYPLDPHYPKKRDFTVRVEVLESFYITSTGRWISALYVKKEDGSPEKSGGQFYCDAPYALPEPKSKDKAD